MSLIKTAMRTGDQNVYSTIAIQMCLYNSLLKFQIKQSREIIYNYTSPNRIILYNVMKGNLKLSLSIRNDKNNSDDKSNSFNY